MSKQNNEWVKNKSSNSVWFLIVGVAAVTIYLNTKAYDPFNTPKLILLILISGWLIGHLLNSYRQEKITSISAEFITVIISLLFLMALFISTILTDIRIVGFIGETQRRNGFFQYFALTVIFLYASRIMNFRLSIRVLKAAISTGLILSFYGIMQITGRDFVKWDNPYNSMISTVGNPNFASAILAILSVIALFSIFIKQISFLFKFISLCMIMMSLTAIIKSQSRQGLLVILFAIMFFLSVYIYLTRPKYRYIAVSSSGFVSILAILGMLQIGPLASVLYKESVSIRGYYWRAGIEMFKENPLTGVGMDRFGAYFKQFREVGYPLNYGYDITTTNAHNVFIQIFATAGVFAGLLYLMLLAHVFRSGLKLVKNSEGDNLKISLALLSAWIGFQAQSLISIDSIGVAVWGWLFGGSILGLASTMEKSKQIPINEGKIFRKRNTVEINLFQPLISVLALVPLGILAFLLIQLESDSLKVRNLANPSVTENRSAVQNYANKVIENPIADPFYKYRASLALYDMGFTSQAKEELNKLVSDDPRNLNYLQALIIFETRENNLQRVIQIRTQVSEYDPWNAQNYLELMKLYKLSGDLSLASEMKDKIISFAANTEIAKSALQLLD
jgi:O-antigen ligase